MMTPMPSAVTLKPAGDFLLAVLPPRAYAVFG